MVKAVYLYGFSTVESSEAVTKFLEEYTGEGTVLSVTVFPPKQGASRSSAIVQFTTAECAEIIIPLADDRSLWYGESYLKAREWKDDMVPKSTVLEELVTLHLGCKISEEKFSVLWTKSDVSVEFGKELIYVHLGFSYDCVEYRLELSSDTIRQIELHCPHGQFTKFLLIQLLGAPRIYKKDVTVKNWVREVDFTPSCSIAQSSALCLELPFECSLPDLHKSCVQIKNPDGHFGLKEGDTFSGSSALGPILTPPLCHMVATLGQVEMLNGDNYRKWRSQVEFYLSMHQNMDYCLLEPKPNDLDLAGDEDSKWHYREWYRTNRMAKNVIRETISKTVKGSIEEPNDASEFLEAIAKKYIDSEKAEVARLSKEFHELKYTGTGNVRVHIMQLIEINGRLRDLRMGMSDEQVVHIALDSLPNTFSNLRTNYNAQETKWTLNKLISVCVDEERRIKKESEPTVVVNLVEKEKAKWKKYNKLKAKKIQNTKVADKPADAKGAKEFKYKCYFCKKADHMKKDCPGFKAWIIKKGFNKQEDAKAK